MRVGRPRRCTGLPKRPAPSELFVVVRHEVAQLADWRDSESFDQSRHSPAGTIRGMRAARCAAGMKPSDNAPNFTKVREAEAVRRKPSWKPYPGKGYGWGGKVNVM